MGFAPTLCIRTIIHPGSRTIDLIPAVECDQPEVFQAQVSNALAGLDDADAAHVGLLVGCIVKNWLDSGWLRVRAG